MVLSGDLWWFGTMLLFGPRWLVTLPLPVLFPLALWRSRRTLFPLIAAALIIAGPFMGLRLPLGKTGCAGAAVLRVLTCNINSGNFDAAALSALILETKADLVALQECPRELRLALPAGWRTVQEGELALLSRFPLHGVKSLQALHPPHRWPRTTLLCCVVAAPGGDLDFCTVHLPSPRYGLQVMLDRATLLSPSRMSLLFSETSHRWSISRQASAFLASRSLPLVVAGDFNMPVQSAIYREYWGSYSNAFSRTGWGYGWTERAALRGIPIGVRIDQVLSGDGFSPCLCRTARDVGSDHLPLIADIARVPVPANGRPAR
jgi:vancomycin resistance protein VanJ